MALSPNFKKNAIRLEHWFIKFCYPKNISKSRNRATILSLPYEKKISMRISQRQSWTFRNAARSIICVKVLEIDSP